MSFVDIHMMRKILHLTEEYIESIEKSKKAKDLVHDGNTLEHEESIFKSFECFRRRMRTEEDDMNFNLQKMISVS